MPFYSKTKRGFFVEHGGRRVDLKSRPVFNSGWPDEQQTARKFMNLRAVRWTVWN